MLRLFTACSLLLLSLAACNSCGSPAPAPAELIGSWVGEARIIVTWCEAQQLDLELEVDASGSVAGTVGDARLVNGRICRNRGALGRGLNIKTDWIVVAELAGPLVAAESIQRASLTIPLNLVGAELHGGVHSSGAHIGPPTAMVLSAADLVLRRP